MKNIDNKEKLIYVNVNQTPEEKIIAFKENIFFSIINSAFLTTFDKDVYEELIKMLENNDSILVPSLPIFRFSEEGKNDDTAKVFSFSLGVINNDYEHGKFELLTVDEIKMYLDKNCWIFLYSVSDETGENNSFRFRTIILNKNSAKIDGNSTINEIHADMNKFSSSFPDNFKNKILTKWANSGLIDESRSEDEKIRLAYALGSVELRLNNDSDKNEDYQEVVYAIIIKLFDKIYLKYYDISQIISEIKEAYKNISKDITIDYETEFVHDFVDAFINKSENKKHLNAIIHALKTGEKNDVTKLIAGLSKLHTAGFKEYENLDMNYLFSDYYQKLDKTLTKEDKEIANEKAFEFFIENNVDTVTLEKASEIDKLNDVISKLFNNRNIFPFLEFNETFNSQILTYDTDLRNKYEKIVNSIEIISKIEIYNKWKSYDEGKNKYFAANCQELVEILISYYTTKDIINFDRKNCHDVACLIINELGVEFNPLIFIEKYMIAKRNIHWLKFNEKFVEQFIEYVKPETKIKLF